MYRQIIPKKNVETNKFFSLLCLTEVVSLSYVYPGELRI